MSIENKTKLQIYPHKPLGDLKYIIYGESVTKQRKLVQLYKLQPFQCVYARVGEVKNITSLPFPDNDMDLFNMLHLRTSFSGYYVHPSELEHPEKFLLGGNCTTCNASPLEQKAFPTCGIYQEKVQKLLLLYQTLKKENNE